MTKLDRPGHQRLRTRVPQAFAECLRTGTKLHSEQASEHRSQQRRNGDRFALGNAFRFQPGQSGNPIQAFADRLTSPAVCWIRSLHSLIVR